MTRIHPFVAGAIALVVLASCGGAETCRGDARCEGAPQRARATFTPKAGTSIGGSVEITQGSSGVSFVADVNGATPGTHGIHIHEKGDCSAPDFSSAGGHWNPTGAPHACPPTAPRHAGDFGNIVVDATGKGHLRIDTDLVSLRAEGRSPVGLAVILHHDADDCVEQPTGHSGARLACAVIRLE